MFFPVVMIHRPYKIDNTKIQIETQLAKAAALRAIRFVRKERVSATRTYIKSQMKWYNWWRILGIRPLTFSEVKERLDSNDSIMNQLDYFIGVKGIYSDKHQAALNILMTVENNAGEKEVSIYVRDWNFIS